LDLGCVRSEAAALGLDAATLFDVLEPGGAVIVSTRYPGDLKSPSLRWRGDRDQEQMATPVRPARMADAPASRDRTGRWSGQPAFPRWSVLGTSATSAMIWTRVLADA
jgi:hypothetical protein